MDTTALRQLVVRNKEWDNTVSVIRSFIFFFFGQNKHVLCLVCRVTFALLLCQSFIAQKKNMRPDQLRECSGVPQPNTINTDTRQTMVCTFADVEK